jgi:dipeptidyl aminopeptidase/acylaminoacyl peptidase
MEAKQITSSNKVGSHIWLDEGKQLLYPSNKDEKVKKAIESGEPLTVFYKIDVSGGESLEYMRVPLTVSSIRALDENHFVLLAGYDPKFEGFESLDKEAKKKFLETLKEDQDYEVAEEIPFWSNGASYTNKKRNRLYLYDKSTGALQPLTAIDESVGFFELDEEYGKIIFASKTFKGKMPLYNDLYTYDLADQKVTKLLSGTHSIQFAYYTGSDRIVFFGNDMSEYGLNQNGVFYTLDLNTLEYELFSEGFNRSVGNSVGSDCRFGTKRTAKAVKGKLYFITTENDSAYLNVMDPQGNVSYVTKINGSVDDFDVVDGKIFINAMRGNSLEEIYAIESGQEKRVTDFNTWVNESHTLSTPEELTFANMDGIEITGWVMKPTEYVEGRSYPGLLNIHGGPKTVYGSIFYHEMQAWANEGYFVFFCNPRGSDGKGDAFADIRGKYGTIDYEDIMLFTNKVQEKYSDMDEDRLFVTGGSYGGFMTNWIIGHTQRFKAAAAQRSISNWTTEYGVTDIGYYFVTDQIAADPWTNYEKLWDHSPLKYADQVLTPTLFIHSDMDYRCWLPEALQMFTALKSYGVDARLCVFKGENHELSRSGKPKHRLRRLEEITNWFGKYGGK